MKGRAWLGVLVSLGLLQGCDRKRSDLKKDPSVHNGSAWIYSGVTEVASRSVTRNRRPVGKNPFARAYMESRLKDLNLELEGISAASPANSVALVSGRVVRVGDRLGDLTVFDISPDRIRLRGSGGLIANLELGSRDRGR
ncbi:MAG: hypothetical protein HN750_07800 [Gemmatimonadales bacterium]|jgi:hypothetical protein|nr:hypothetical protein [Gemmatimonadales bacterium]